MSAASQLVKALEERFESRKFISEATVTRVKRDNNTRAISAHAAIDNAEYPLGISYGQDISVGSKYEVENVGSPTLPQWRISRSVSPLAPPPRLLTPWEEAIVGPHTYNPGDFAAGDLITGDGANLYYSQANNTLQLRKGTTVIIELDGDTGDATFGQVAANKPNLRYDATAGSLSLRVNTDPYITLDQTGAVVEQNIRSEAAETYATGVGWWMGIDASVAKLRLGDSGGDHMRWDGVNLTVTGAFIGDGSQLSGVLTDPTANYTWTGSHTFDVTAGRTFMVKDTSQGTVDGVVWYEFGTGQLHLGNTGANAWEVNVRGNLEVDGNMRLIGASTVSTDTNTLTLSPATNLLLDPGGSIIYQNWDSSSIFKSNTYVSQSAGWAIDHGNLGGDADFRYLFATELHARSFIADLQVAKAGLEIIAPSVTLLAEDFIVPEPGEATNGGALPHMVVRDLPSATGMQVFEVGDIIQLRVFDRSNGSVTIANAWGVVSEPEDLLDGTQRWKFTRSVAPNAGAVAGSTVIRAESIVLDYGVDGNGIYEVNTIDGSRGSNSPYDQIARWRNHPATGLNVHVRTGNLRGITGWPVDGAYMSGEDEGFIVWDDGGEWELEEMEFGIWAGVSVNREYLIASNQRIEAHGMAFSLYNDTDTEVIRMDPFVPYIAVGDPVPVAYGDTGIWMGKHTDDTYRASIGNQTQYLRYDGSVLTVSGSIQVLGGNAATQTYVNDRRVVTVDGNFNVLGTDTISWDSVVITTGTGETYAVQDSSVTPGNPVSIPARRYITWIEGSTAFAVSSGTGGINIIPIAVADPGANQASIRVIAGTTWISGDQIVTGSIVASNIKALTITANELAANSVTADKINVTNLQAVNTLTGSLTVDGTLTVGTNGQLYSGLSDFTGTGLGYLLEYNAGTPRMFVGEKSSGALVKGIQWDGSLFSLKNAQASDGSVNELSIGDPSEEGFVDINMSLSTGAGNFDYAFHATDGGNTSSGVSALYRGYSNVATGTPAGSDAIDRLFDALTENNAMSDGFYSDMINGTWSDFNSKGVPFKGISRNGQPVAVFNQNGSGATGPVVWATSNQASRALFYAEIGGNNQVAYYVDDNAYTGVIALDTGGGQIEMGDGGIDNMGIISFVDGGGITGTPSDASAFGNTGNIDRWLNVEIGGTTYKMPLFDENTGL